MAIECLYEQWCQNCQDDEMHELLEIVSGVAKCLNCGCIDEVDNEAIPEEVWAEYERLRHDR